MRAKALSSAEVREVFKVDRDGTVWRKEYIDKRGHKRPLKKAILTTSNNGYLQVRLYNKWIRIHRLVYAYFNGDIDENGIIDHIDGDILNNCIDNLRLSTLRKNQQNRIEHRKGRLVGCCLPKGRNKWTAKIKINGKKQHLGNFNTEQEAHEAYLKAVQQLEG
jgi:hypothetical protein